MSFYNYRTFGDVHYHEFCGNNDCSHHYLVSAVLYSMDHHKFKAQLRSYRGRATESELGVEYDKKLPKREEIDLHEVTEERQEYRKDSIINIVRLQRKLHSKFEVLKGYQRDFEDTTTMIELTDMRQKRLGDMPDLAREDLKSEQGHCELDL